IRLLQNYSAYPERRVFWMRMASQDYVPGPNMARDRNRRVFVRHLRRIDLAGAQTLFRAHVHRDDDEIDFLSMAQHGDPLPGFADGLVKFKARVIGHVFPVGNPRRRQSQDADANPADFLDEIRLIVSVGGASFISIRRKPWKPCFAARSLQDFQAEIVL